MTTSPSDPRLDLLTTEEVAELFRVCKRSVERLNLPYLKVGRLRRYRRTTVEEYMEKMES
jgi:excisionase family DNA binding protein